MSDWHEYRSFIKDYRRKYINKNLQVWVSFSLVLMIIFLISKMLMNVYIVYLSAYSYALAQIFVSTLFFIIYNIKHFGDKNTWKFYLNW
jgi:hypothetical protein